MAGQLEVHLLCYMGAPLTNGNNASQARMPSPPFSSLTHRDVEAETD